MAVTVNRRQCMALMAAAGVTAASRQRAAAQDIINEGSLKGTLLVLEKRSHALSFYDLASGRRDGIIALQNYPHEFAVDSKNAYAYVAHYGVEASSDTGPGGSAIFVIDLAKRAQVSSIDCRPFNRIHGIRMDGKDRLYALSEEKAVLLEFDTPQAAQYPDRASNAGGIKSHLFSITRDGTRAYIANILSNSVTLIRPYEPDVLPVIVATGLWPEGNCLSPDEKTLYVTNRKSFTLTALDSGTMAIRQAVKIRGDAVRVYALPDGRLVLANLSDKSVSLLDPAMKEIANIPVDGKPVALSLHPAEPILFVSLDTNKIALVDWEKHQIIGSFSTGLEPDVTYLLT